VTAIVHLAADTTFSSPLDRARAVNTLGTQRVLEIAEDCETSVPVWRTSARRSWPVGVQA
jgi:nucleoside-diphosphate-sugar epimerase